MGLTQLDKALPKRFLRVSLPREASFYAFRAKFTSNICRHPIGVLSITDRKDVISAEILQISVDLFGRVSYSAFRRLKHATRTIQRDSSAAVSVRGSLRFFKRDMRRLSRPRPFR